MDYPFQNLEDFFKRWTQDRYLRISPLSDGDIEIRGTYVAYRCMENGICYPYDYRSVKLNWGSGSILV